MIFDTQRTLFHMRLKSFTPQGTFVTLIRCAALTLQVTVVSVSVADLVIAIHTFSTQPLKSSPVNNTLLFES